MRPARGPSRPAGLEDEMPSGVYTPTRDEIRAAAGRVVPHVLAPGLHVLFCGINPGLYSAAVQHHFARPGNRFWTALHSAGFTERLLTPWQESEFIACGYGLTSLVRRATATARELAPAELVAGRRRLMRHVQRYRPRWVAVLGLSAYRTAFRRPQAITGPQSDALTGTGVWVLPSSSGANGSYPLVALVRELRAFRRAVDQLAVD